MAVLGIFTVSMSKDQYEALRKEVKWETDLEPGALFHAAAFDDSGILHVADVWESPEAMNTFVEQRLMPGFMNNGIPMPDVVVYPTYNINAYPGLDQHRL